MELNRLTQARHDLLNKLENYFNENHNVVGQFLGGSLAKGNPDFFSDIDYRIVMDDTTSKQKTLCDFYEYFKDGIAFVETSNSFYGVFHFMSFIKVDLFVYYSNELSPNVWFREIKILNDHNESLSNLKLESSKLAFVFSSNQLINYLNKYTSYLHELYRRSMRSESNYSEHCSLMMKHILTSLWLVEKGHIPNNLGDWSKYEGERSLLQAAEQRLLDTYTPITLTATEEFINDMNNEMLNVATTLSTKFALKVDLNHYSKLFSVIGV